MKCVGDILGTEFCWPKEKKIKYKIAFYPISEVMFPKDMKDKCNPNRQLWIFFVKSRDYEYGNQQYRSFDPP